MKRLLIMGAPGSGKGTQAGMLALELRVPTISTGELFRTHVERQTELGARIRRLIAAGEFVPDELTSSIVRERLSLDDVADGFILDGYPRTLPQVEELDIILAKQETQLDSVLYLEVDVESLVERLLDRGRAQGRIDDAEESVQHRLSLFAEKTAPLREIYRVRGQLISVDGVGSVAHVSTLIRDTVLASRPVGQRDSTSPTLSIGPREGFDSDRGERS